MKISEMTEACVYVKNLYKVDNQTWHQIWAQKSKQIIISSSGAQVEKAKYSYYSFFNWELFTQL